jgi:hypothetical protein
MASEWFLLIAPNFATALSPTHQQSFASDKCTFEEKEAVPHLPMAFFGFSRWAKSLTDTSRKACQPMADEVGRRGG